MFNNKEYVLSVEKSKSFSKAAKELYISQPSLSASIKRIEKEIGAPLFDRSTSPLSLTEIGEKYIECANEISSIEENFKNYVGDNMNMLTGEIKIGGSSMFNSFVLADLISNFNKEYPKIEFNILEEHSQNLINMLIDGKLDIAIDNVLISNKSIRPITYKSEKLLLAVPKNLAVNEKLKDKALTATDIKTGVYNNNTQVVSLKEFEDEPFVILKSENDTGKRALRLFKKHDIKPNIKFRLDQQITAYNFTCSGIGITFVSDTLVKHLIASPDICYYMLDDDEEISRNIYFYVKSNRYLTNACKLFIDESVQSD